MLIRYDAHSDPITNRRGNHVIEGGCECGAIRYETAGQVTDFSHCHCSQCRRLHGAPYVSFAGVVLADMTWKSGPGALRVYDSSAKNRRYFCASCGSQIMVVSAEEPDVAYLALGCIDGDPELPDGYHQFVDSKAPWVNILDELPQFPEAVDE